MTPVLEGVSGDRVSQRLARHRHLSLVVVVGGGGALLRVPRPLTERGVFRARIASVRIRLILGKALNKEEIIY